MTSDSDVMLIPSIRLNLSTGTTKHSTVLVLVLVWIPNEDGKDCVQYLGEKIGCDSAFSSSNGERQLRGRTHEGSKYTTQIPEISVFSHIVCQVNVRAFVMDV